MKVKLICGIIYNSRVEVKKVKKRLSGAFSDIDFNSKIIDFDFTNYYYEEMGRPLKRVFVSFKKLIHPSRLADIKNRTIKIEEKFKKKGRRKVNLDPGYLEASKLVLASTKNFSHRIYLKDGIYGEITYRYEKGEFTDLPWTFPDYRSDTYKEILEKIRAVYKEQLNNRRNR
ncbi:MAG: DUF4416 family protein [Elusimicrobiota bacterium]